MPRLSHFFAFLFSLFLLSTGLVHAREYSTSTSSDIQLIKAKKKQRQNQQQQPPSNPNPTPSQANLPEPYRSAKLLPFNSEGWYSNGEQIKSLFMEHQINVAIEVGCWLGLSTRNIATLLLPNGKLYAIDHWRGSIEHQHLPILPTLYDQFLSNVIHAELTNVIIPMRMSSLEAALQIRSMGIVPDFIYIDASHDTESVLADLNAWFPFIKGHGILCGDDWTWESVRTAVEIFAEENQLTIEASDNFWRLVE
jgi:hypothetical protein